MRIMRLAHISLFSLDRNSVSSFKIQALNADKKTFWAHPVDTEKWHCQGHFEAHIDFWKGCFSVKSTGKVTWTQVQ